MAFIPCNNGGGATEHTATRSITTNGTTDLGVEHTYRYISTDVIPRGGIACQNDDPRTKGKTWWATRNYIYLWICVYIGPNNSQGWNEQGSISVSGARAAWAATRAQNNNGNAYNAIGVAFIVGNGANVTVSWSSTANYGNYRQYIFYVPI